MKKKEDQIDRLALVKISNLGQGIKEDIKDWANIGRMAVKTAQDTLAAKCKTCGKIL